MIEWKFDKKEKKRDEGGTEYKLEHVLDVINKSIYQKRTLPPKDLEKAYQDWLDDLEDLKVHKYSDDWSWCWNNKSIGLALVRRTFPALFANKVVGVQPMSAPVGLSYTMRMVYDNGNLATDKDDPRFMK
jgi:hypothetical protein